MTRRGVLAATILAIGCGCGGGRAPPSEPLGWIEDEPIEASVVQMVANRDGVDEAEARERVADTLRAVAAARAAEAAKTEPGELVDARRREHLTRAAQARVWLEDDFAPSHRPQDIPDSDAMLEEAKAKPKFIHPELHILCQLLAVPTEAESLDQFEALTSDPAWKQKAKARFDPAAERMQRYVHPDDPQACALMQKLIRFEVAEADGVTLRVEAGAMHLDACGKLADDGSCAEPRWIPEWVEPVRKLQPLRFGEPFYTRYGWHLVFLAQIRPERSLEDPETLPWLREQIHPEWQRAAFEDYIARLGERRAIRIANASEQGP